MIKDAAKELFPPGVPRVIRWRLSVFAALVLMAIHVAWACNVFAGWGLVGFARADALEHKVASVTDELTKTNMKVDAISVQLIEQGIFTAKDSECTATDAQAKRFFAQRVLALSREYFNITRTVINIPPCRG